MNSTIKQIEEKLMTGVQQFTPEEVAYLLNYIRIIENLNKLEKGQQ